MVFAPDAPRLLRVQIESVLTDLALLSKPVDFAIFNLLFHFLALTGIKAKIIMVFTLLAEGRVR